MKKVLALLLALIMVLGLAGCTNGQYATYSLGDIYSLGNVINEVPYKIGYYNSQLDKWSEAKQFKTIMDVVSFEQSSRVVYNCTYDEPTTVDVTEFELDYYFKCKSIDELNTIANKYYNKLKSAEDVQGWHYEVDQNDGGFNYTLVMNPTGNYATANVYYVEMGVSTFNSEVAEAGDYPYVDDPYIYVYVGKVPNWFASYWWSDN